MSIERRELHELVDDLPDEQLALAAADLRRRAVLRAVGSDAPFAWVGKYRSSDEKTDVSSNIDRYLAAGFGADSVG